MKQQFPKDYYKKYEDRYSTIYKRGVRSWAKIAVTEEINKFLKAANLDKTFRGIDLGCGEGFNSIYLAKEGYSITGIDIAPSGVARAKEIAEEHNVNIEYITDDVLSLSSIKDSKFDFGISVACLHMFVDQVQRNQFFQQIKRIIKNGGYFLLVNMGNGINEKKTSPEEYLRIEKRSLPDNSNEMIEIACLPMWTKTWKNHLTELCSAGFEIVEYFDSCNQEFGNCMSVILKI